MSQLNLQVTGLKELDKKFSDTKRIKKPMERFIRRMESKFRKQVMENTPVAKGKLRASYFTEYKFNSNPMSARVYNEQAYARPLEFSGFSPRRSGIIPFFRPAVEWLKNNMSQLHKQLGDELEREYKKP